MPDYETDRKFADQHIKKVCELIAPYMLIEAPVERDMKEATDLILLKAKYDLTVGVRFRRACYAERYPWDITFRNKRPNGVITEFAKIVQGWCDFYFYGHVQDSNEIFPWFFIDLAAFRAHLIQDSPRWSEGPKSRHYLVSETMANKDGTEFRTFDLRSFRAEPKLVLASNPAIPEALASFARAATCIRPFADEVPF